MKFSTIILLISILFAISFSATSQNSDKKLAQTPPMGWNSFDRLFDVWNNKKVSDLDFTINSNGVVFLKY